MQPKRRRAVDLTLSALAHDQAQIVFAFPQCRTLDDECKSTTGRPSVPLALDPYWSLRSSGVELHY